jgi:tape measure domain-containing protein
MADYGFTMSVNDLSSAQLARIGANVRGLRATVQTETEAMNNNFGNLGNTIQQVGSYLAVAFSVTALINFGRELLDITTRFQTFENVIKYSSMGIVDNAQNINYLRDAVDRLHLPMEQAFDSFSQLQAGFYGTGIEGEKLRKVFEGMETAITVLHLDPRKSAGALYALKEMAEMGTVQSRQLRRMLAIYIPGTMPIAAKAMNMTMPQFNTALKEGKVSSAEFIPKFAEGLQERFGAGLPNATKSLMSQLNQMHTESVKMMLDMGNQLMPLWTDIIQTISKGFKEIKNIFDSLNQNNGLVNLLKTIFDWAVKLIPIWITYKGVMFAVTLATDGFAVILSLLSNIWVTEAAANAGATAALEGFSEALVTTGIGALVVALGLAVEKMIKLNSEFDDFMNKTYSISKIRNFTNETQNIANSIAEKVEAGKKTGDKSLLQAAVNDYAQFQKMQKDSIGIMKYRDSINMSQMKFMHPQTTWQRIREPGGNGMLELFKTDGARKTINSLNSLHAGLIYAGQTVKGLDKTMAPLLKAGFKPAAEYSGLGNAGKNQAYNTSALAGASGGLGSSKIIHISIGTVQKNYGVKESESHASAAVQLLLREINNLSDSQNSE